MGNEAKKIGRAIFNVVWVIFVGVWSAISSGVVGVLCCITIIGIPFGLQHFKFIKLVFSPAGKEVCLHYGKHPIMNTLWLIFGGFGTALLFFIMGGFMRATLVGTPIARQIFKMGAFNFAPFGAEIVEAEEYTSRRDREHDEKLFFGRFWKNPHVVVGVHEDGTPQTALQWLALRRGALQSYIKKDAMRNTVWAFLGLLPFIASVGAIFCLMALFYEILWFSSEHPIPLIIRYCLVLLAGLSVSFGVEEFFKKALNSFKGTSKCYKEFLIALTDFYPKGSPFGQEREIGLFYRAEIAKGFMTDKQWFSGISGRTLYLLDYFAVGAPTETVEKADSAQ